MIQSTVRKWSSRERSADGRSAESPTPESLPLVQALDVLPVPLCFLRPDGSPVYSNAAYRRFCESDLRDEIASTALSVFVAELRVRVRARIWKQGETSEIAARRLTTSAADLLVRGSYVQAEMFGASGVLLIVIERAKPTPYTDAYLQDRYGLTPREIRVARILAQGRSNAELALALHISPHTARHHTENVKSKLGVRSRAEVAAHLNGSGGPPM